MNKRDERRKLELRRERLRQLTQLSTEEAGRVAGGWSEAEDIPVGLQYSRTCKGC